MTDINALAETVAKKHGLDNKTALSEVRNIARQVARFDRTQLDEDNISDEQAGFILGAVASTHKPFTDALITEVTTHAEHVAEADAQRRAAKKLRDAAILAASEGGHTHAELQAASGLKSAQIITILRQQREERAARQ